MINLDSTLKSLELILSGAITTNQLPFVVNYVEILSSDQSVSGIKENDGTSNNGIAVTLVAAPDGTHTRTVKEFTIQNADTVNATVTVRINNNGTFRNLNVITLSPGDNLQYCDGGFSVITGVSIFPITVPNGGTGDTTLTNHGVLLGQGTSPIVATAVGATNTLLHGNTGADPSYSAVVEADLSLSDITTDNVSSNKHGFTPKSPADATQFLNGAVAPVFAAIKDSDLSTSDITTNNVSITKHGFAPKAPNDATQFLDGTGAYSTPSSSGSFTPTLIGASGSGQTYTTQFGSYAKSGKIVRCIVSITLSGKGTVAGGVVVAGLPFTSLVGGPLAGAMNISFFSGLTTSITNMFGIVAANATTCSIWYLAAPATTTGQLLWSDIGATTRLDLMIEYVANA